MTSNFCFQDLTETSKNLEVFLLSNFMEALKESGLKSFCVSEASRARACYVEKRCAAVVVFRSIEESKLAEIDFIASLKSVSRLGLASKLVESLHNDFEEIWLEVSSSNMVAQHFYQKNGFIIVGKRRPYYKDGSDALNMVKRRG